MAQQKPAGAKGRDDKRTPNHWAEIGSVSQGATGQGQKTVKMIQVGDVVTRMLAGKIPMELRVTKIDDELIHCGDWTFDKIWGFEVDEFLGWGMNQDGKVYTGSYIVMEGVEPPEIKSPEEVMADKLLAVIRPPEGD